MEGFLLLARPPLRLSEWRPARPDRGTSGAIIAITSMLLISINPFAFRKIVFVAVALLGLSSVVCFADPLFMTGQFGHPTARTRLAPPINAPQQAPAEPSLVWRFSNVRLWAATTCAR